MPADLDLMRRFVAAITSAEVSLDGPQGRITVPRDQLSELVEEAEEGRTWRDDITPTLEYSQAVVQDLEAYLEEQRAVGPGDPRLQAILDQREDDTMVNDPELVALVRQSLAMLGVPQATEEQADAILDVISAFTDRQTSNGSHAAEGQQVLQQPMVVSGPAIAAGQQVVARPAGVPQMAPPRVTAVPVPADPPPFREKTAEELGLVQRGAGGRFDAGSNLRTTGM